MEDIWTILCLLCLASNEEFVFSESELEQEQRHLTFWKDLTIQNLQAQGKTRPVSLPQRNLLLFCRKESFFCETVRERKKRSFWWYSTHFLVQAHCFTQWLKEKRQTQLPSRCNGFWLHCLSGDNACSIIITPNSLSATKLSISITLQVSFLARMKYIPWSFLGKVLVIKIYYCPLLALQKGCWNMACSHSLPPFLPSVSTITADPNKCIVPWGRENEVILNW